MKKLVLLSLLLVAVQGLLFSQTDNEKRSAFQLGFVPPLSTNGAEAGKYTNSVSINFIAGVSRNEEIFTFGSVANIIHNDAGGLQFAGIINTIGNNTSGFQFAGVSNLIGNNGCGFLFAGINNTVRGNYNGVQFAGAVNMTANYKGAQFAGIGNIAGDVSGFQFGGIFNVARRVNGVQFGTILNIAESSDYPIGLINIIRDGEMSAGITYDEAGSIVAGFRSGGRVLYGILGVGYNHRADDEYLVTEGGFGAHIPVASWFRINTELKGSYMSKFTSENKHVNKAGLSILPAFKILPHLEIFGGPSINYMETDNLKNKDMFPGNKLWRKFNDNKLKQVYVGYTVGTQIIF